MCAYDRRPMLPRLNRNDPSHAPACLAAPGRSARNGHVSPTQPGMRRWLQAPGSLTARLRRHGQVTVRVIRQGQARLWPHEQGALGMCHGHVREVLLLIDGRPAVWARSVAALRSVKGPWRAIKGLGSRPLAELLFERRHVLRTPLVGARLHRHSPQWGELCQAWAQTPGAGGDAPPQWARHSVFERHGQPLQVLEAFAPWVCNLSAGRSTRHR